MDQVQPLGPHIHIFPVWSLTRLSFIDFASKSSTLCQQHCSFLPNYARFSKLCYFFKLCSSKTMANMSKNTFSLIRSLYFPFVDYCQGTVSGNCVWFQPIISLRYRRYKVLLKSASIADAIVVALPLRYWDWRVLPWDFRFAYRPPFRCSVNRKYCLNIEQCQPIIGIWESMYLSKPKMF